MVTKENPAGAGGATGRAESEAINNVSRHREDVKSRLTTG